MQSDEKSTKNEVGKRLIILEDTMIINIMVANSTRLQHE